MMRSLILAISTIAFSVHGSVVEQQDPLTIIISRLLSSRALLEHLPEADLKEVRSISPIAGVSVSQHVYEKRRLKLNAAATSKYFRNRQFAMEVNSMIKSKTQLHVQFELASPIWRTPRS